MIPSYLMSRIHEVRDMTLDRNCYLYTRRSSARFAGPTGTYPEEGYQLQGMFQCRIDAMEEVTLADGTIRRPFALTLQHDAPKLLAGDVVMIDQLSYMVDSAQDELVELIVRRYTITIALKDFLDKLKSER